MKLFNKLHILPFVGFAAAAAFIGCSEDATLDGAKAVYIELTPSSNITLHLEDTTRVTARVTNVNGDVINTPILWSIDDDSAIKLIEDSVPGSTLITCGDGAQGKSTTLRATLENNDYAVTTVTVVKNAPLGVNAVEEDGTLLAEKRSWDTQHDSIIFAVEPRQLLMDFEPTCSFDGLEPYGADGGIAIDRKHGLVTLHFSTGTTYGEYHPSVTVGESAVAKSGSCLVRIIPPLEGASFYGPSYAGLPYIEGRPPQGTLSMWYAYTYENTIDVNSTDEVRVAFNISTGLPNDIEQAYNCYRWEVVEGSSVMKIKDDHEYVEGNGFDAVLAVRSGLQTGTTVFHCITPDTVLVATFNVRNFKEEFPVNQITCSHTSIETGVGVNAAVEITMGTVPAASFGYHKPVAKVDDPTIVSVSEYNGNNLEVVGLRPGTTNIRFTSNEAPELVIPVTITETYSSIVFDRSDVQNAFAGQTLIWNANVTTASGLPNTVQVNFESDNNSIATVANVAGVLNQVSVTGVAAGRAAIKASIGGVSVSRNVNVVALPDNQTFTSPTGLSLRKSGTNLRLYVSTSAYVEFTGAYNAATGYRGSYSTSQYAAKYTVSNASAPVSSGTLTIDDSTATNKKVVSFNITVEFADGIRRTFTANDLEITSY